MKKPVIAVTQGDINGIGPEVVLKALAALDPKRCTPVVIGYHEVFAYYRELLGLDTPPLHPIQSLEEAESGIINIFDFIINNKPKIKPGHITKQAGYAAMQSVEKAADWCIEGKAQALVTAPISKESVNLAGWNIPGHTEFLAAKCNTDHYMMMLVNDTLRVGLVSIHDPLKKVTERITTGAILQITEVMNQSLIRDFGINKPRIAILGLNPHAGDGGYIGTEEIEIIRPAIETARKQAMAAEGPFAADGFFGNRLYQQYDGIIAMYHDQGLIPFKTLSFNAGVNFTAGLPLIRTSPDHGTAFDIAGQNKASEKSFLKALQLAVTLANNKLERV